MTFVCLGIAKLECQISLGISFFSLICPCMICLKEKYAMKNQKQKYQICFKIITSVYSRRCESYRMYLESDSPHQQKCSVNDICMLRHSKIGMSNIIGYLFSLSNMPMHDMLKRKICKEKSKAK